MAYEGRKYHQNKRIEGGKRDERKSHKALLRSRIIDERMFTQQGLQSYLLKNHSRKKNGSPQRVPEGASVAEPRSQVDSAGGPLKPHT